MSYVSIVVIVTGAPDDGAATSLACDIVERHGATATIIIAVPLMIPAAAPIGLDDGLMSPQVWEAIEESRRLLVQRAKTVINDATARRGLAVGGEGRGPRVLVAPEAATPWLAVQRELPLADLAVIGRSSAHGDGPWTGVFAEALMASRAPVLVVGDGPPMAGSPAVVAWDGSPEAGRAVRAAVPLLQEASKVVVLQDPEALNVSPGSAADPERLMTYLSARGVEDISLTRLKDGKPGPELLRTAESCGAGLLVAGAFGHARLAEAVFGGATRSFLEASGGPHLLLCH